ncbi:hypothetical protein FOL47_006285 [Perkinsus chesapeaki]|uniref:DUF7164 domain-containing protein n=1 Tax=Perkinsus chesapeaki TaxID=330153 RepID=A0A7J6MZU4_PERCH|nr:hypothetical protein FOL47_006285 [Perkinsus chesapeaki]
MVVLTVFTVTAGIILLGLQFGMWPHLHYDDLKRKPFLVPSRSFRHSIETNNSLTYATATSRPIWEIIGSEAYWKTPQGRARLKAETHEMALEVDSVLEVLAQGRNKSHIHVRGVFVCLPADKVEGFTREFKALYLSWLLAVAHEPATLKTDLVVLTELAGSDLAVSLGCKTQPRHNDWGPSSCVIAPYTPIESRSTPIGEPEDPLMGYAAYMNSILSMAEYDGYIYDSALRTDADVFLMPGFYNWTLPQEVNLIAGTGGYMIENTARHLPYVSATLELRNDFDKHNFGSTWFGEFRLVRAAARLSVSVARWLLTQEFSEYEKCCASTLSWPHWHWPVTSLYSGHVALNHIGNVVKSGEGFGNLDEFSHSDERASTDRIKHVHCWQTEGIFAKLAHKRGMYDNMDLTQYANMTTVKEFSLVLAVSSIRLTNTDWARLSSSPSALVDPSSWFRPVPTLQDGSAGTFEPLVRT